MSLFILAQIFGVLGALSMVLSSWQKTRKKILFFLIFDNVFYFIQYILLGAFSGAFTNVVGLFRIFSFRRKGTTKFFKTNAILYIVLALYIITGILTYDGVTSLFPIIASLLYSAILWQDKPKNIRIGTSIMLFMWFVYNITVKAYVGVLSEGILFLSSVMAIIKIDILKDSSDIKEELKKFREFKQGYKYKEEIITKKGKTLYCGKDIIKDENGYRDEGNNWINASYDLDEAYSKLLAINFPYEFSFKRCKVASIQSLLEAVKFTDVKMQKKIIVLSGDDAKLIGNTNKEWKRDGYIYFKKHQIDIKSEKYNEFLEELFISAIQNPLYRKVVKECPKKIVCAYLEEEDNEVLTRREFEHLVNTLHAFLNTSEEK